MKRYAKQVSLCVLIAAVMGIQAVAQTRDYPKECSEHAKELLKKAWVAQPMNARGNNADPAKAESLYKAAVKDSPRCSTATALLVGLLRRNRDYQAANKYNELLLRRIPDDPAALSQRADLISALNGDYATALEIKMKLLDVPNFNVNGNLFYDVAKIYSLMNRLDESLSYLKLAWLKDKGWVNEKNAQVDPEFDNLRKDSRFWVLVNQQ